MNADHYAIVIGLKTYSGFVDPPANLSGPENDADSISQWLADPQGGDLLTENIKQIRSSDFLTPPDAPWPGHLNREAFMWIEAKASANLAAGKGRKVGKRLYVYMSGHGFSTPQRLGCLLTGDAGPGLVSANICASNWLHWWQDAGYFEEYVLLLDSCMNRMALAVPSPAPISSITTDATPGPTFIAFAAKRPLKAVEIPIPEDAEKFHGVFTWAFLEGLRGAAVNAFGTVTGRSMANWLRAALHHRLSETDRSDPGVSQEPEIVNDGPGLIFARGVSPLLFDILLTFPPDAVGKVARIWSRTPPAPSQFQAQTSTPLRLRPGLYVVEVPDAGYRHGFEVVRASTITVADKGPAVSPQPVGTVFKCFLSAGDAANEISITAPDYEEVDNRPGSIDARLTFGIYRSRIRGGDEFVDRVFLLDRDVTPAASDIILVGPEDAAALPRAVSAVPFRHARMSHEDQSDLAADLRTQSGPPPDGAQIGIMARSWTGINAAAIPKPWSGIKIVNARGEDVVSTGDKMQTMSSDPSAYMLFDVPPDTFFLRCPTGSGRTVELTLTAVPNWRLEAYVLRSRVGTQEAMPRLSFLMRKAAQGWSEQQNERLEKASLALADERPILNAELKDLLLRKFENPIEGIVGGHLLLIQREHYQSTPLELLNEVVTNLRGLLGADHPDVEALSLRCLDVSLRRKKPFTAPPMFERSWRLIIEASRDNPGLVPRSLWNRVQALSMMPPYLAWAIDSNTKKDYRAALVEAARVGLSTPELAGHPEMTRLESIVLDMPASLESIALDTPLSVKPKSTKKAAERLGGTAKKVAGKRKATAKVASAGSATLAADQARRFAQAYQLPPSVVRALQKKVKK